MAKKKRTPALWAFRIWQAVIDGSLVIEKLPGSPIIRVLSGRIRMTWYLDGNSKHDRIRLSRVLLNPRWIKLPKNVFIKEELLTQMTDEELASKGIILRDSQYYVLIYQQIRDIFTLARQIRYVRDRYYKQEARHWKHLFRVIGSTNDNEYLQDLVLGLNHIASIKQHMQKRLDSVNSRIEQLIRTRRDVHLALQKLEEQFDQVLVSSAYRNGIAISLQTQIIKITRVLCKDNPYAQSAQLAVLNVERATTRLQKNKSRDELLKAHRNLNMAIAHLVEPEDELTQLRKIGFGFKKLLWYQKSR